MHKIPFLVHHDVTMIRACQEQGCQRTSKKSHFVQTQNSLEEFVVLMRSFSKHDTNFYVIGTLKRP